MKYEKWPRADVPYDAEVRSPAVEHRWQRAIHEALEDGRLRLERSGKSGYDLVGPCPRCGHTLYQYIQFTVYTEDDSRYAHVRPPRGRREPVTAAFTIRCTCGGKHPGRGETQTGCGYAPHLRVTLTEPINGGAG